MLIIQIYHSLIVSPANEMYTCDLLVISYSEVTNALSKGEALSTYPEAIGHYAAVRSSPIIIATRSEMRVVFRG
uniref:Type II toxin-antitoxin system VapC family toxin n=1 Tax=Steinernema glaseri TaxID=37863 RepID=A0A1I8AUY5_9BILA